MNSFQDLGSGFHIAMKRLGNPWSWRFVRGDQSGFINEMGFDTYQKIMQEALEELKDEDMEGLFQNEEESAKNFFNSVKDVNIDTDLELMLPDDYVNSTGRAIVVISKTGGCKERCRA